VATSGGYKPYASYEAAVIDWFTIVKSRYINAGLTSIYTICRPYVGTSTACSSSGWAGKVFTYTQKYRSMAPPPTPTPTPALVSAPAHGGAFFEQAVPTVPVAQVATNKITNQVAMTDLEQAQRVLPPLLSIAVGFILLLALAVAAWGMLIIQGIPQAGKRKLEGEDDAAICPPVFTSQLPSLSDSNPLPAFQPVTKQYTMSGSQKIVTRAQGASGWQPSPDFIETQALPVPMVDTENLPSQPQRGGLHLPTRIPIPLEATQEGKGGLLRRYQNQQSQEMPVENPPQNS
jgi:hypothetical protein